MISKDLLDQVMALPSELRSELADCLSLNWDSAEIAEDGAEWLSDEAEARQLLDKLMALTAAERKEWVAAIDESLLPEDEWERECLIEAQRRMDRIDQGLDRTFSYQDLLRVLGR